MAMDSAPTLPPGQKLRGIFPRFGLPWFAHKFPMVLDRVEIRIGGNVAQPVVVSRQLAALPRTEQVSDLHCVATWSRLDLHWSGVRFRDLYEQVVLPEARPLEGATTVIIRGQDGYIGIMQLYDLLADDVLLADHLDGLPLTLERGAPIRLVAPAHYGYKGLKYVDRIEFWRDDRHYRFAGPSFLKLLEHRRGRVAFEERSDTLPNWVCQLIYPPIIGITAWMFRVGAAYYQRRQKKTVSD